MKFLAEMVDIDPKLRLVQVKKQEAEELGLEEKENVELVRQQQALEKRCIENTKQKRKGGQVRSKMAQIDTAKP